MTVGRLTLFTRAVIREVADKIIRSPALRRWSSPWLLSDVSPQLANRQVTASSHSDHYMLHLNRQQPSTGWK